MADKICIKCKTRKSVVEFPKNNLTSDGFLNTCSACLAKQKRPKQSLRKAIDAKCKECIYDPIGGCGKWREQVAACTSPCCPLFDVRPGA